MNYKKTCKALALKIILLVALPSFADTKEAKILLSNMTLSQKINQVFIFNIYKSKVDKQYKKILSKHRPGSYILFAKDIKSAKSLYNFTHLLQKEYIKNDGLPALLMIDQEGGHVTRIKTKPNLPSPLSVSTSGDPSLSYKVGVETSIILHQLGINVNLAPVVDLSDPFTKNFIGNRSFGNEPSTVIQFASTQALALEENLIIPTFKHFPGHGDVTQDSHKKLPKKLSTLDELRKHDLLPFKKLIKQHPEAAILIGHLAFPNIDPSGAPATFSKILLNNILKRELNFKGLIITDDLQMHALKSFGNLTTRSKLAFNAGSDLLMVTGSYKTQRNLIANFSKLVREKKVSMARLNESVLKIIAAKLKIKNSLNLSNTNYAKAQKIIKKSVNSLKNYSDLIINNNYKKSLGDVLPVLSKEIEDVKNISVYSAHRSFYYQLKKNYPTKKFKLTTLSKSNQTSIYKRSSSRKNSLNIFYITGLGTLRMLSRLSNQVKKNTIVVNSMHPGALSNKDLYKNVINVNTPYVFSGKILSRILLKKASDQRSLANQ